MDIKYSRCSIKFSCKITSEGFRKIKNREIRAACEFNKQNVLCYGNLNVITHWNFYLAKGYGNYEKDCQKLDNDGTWRQGYIVSLPIDYPFIKMVEISRIKRKRNKNLCHQVPSISHFSLLQILILLDNLNSQLDIFRKASRKTNHLDLCHEHVMFQEIISPLCLFICATDTRMK